MRPANSADRALLHDHVTLGLAELVSGRGGLNYASDLAGFLGTNVDALESAIVESVIGHGLVTDGGFGVATNGLALIYVHPNFRRQRIGTSIYAALQEQGPIELWAKPGDRTAKSFAESLGLKARLLVMSAEQDPNDEG